MSSTRKRRWLQQASVPSPSGPAPDAAAGSPPTDAPGAAGASRPALGMEVAGSAEGREGVAAAGVRLEDRGGGGGLKSGTGRRAGRLAEWSSGNGTADEPQHDATRADRSSDAGGVVEQGSDRLLLDWLMLHKVRGVKHKLVGHIVTASVCA